MEAVSTNGATRGFSGRRATPEDVKRSDESEKGKKKVQLISAEALREVFNNSETKWIRRGDLINKLIEKGYSQATAYRTIDREEGYHRNSIEYQGQGKKTELCWIGFNDSFNPRWKHSHP